MGHDDDTAAGDISKCPVMGHTAGAGAATMNWFPNQINLKVLHQNAPECRPVGAAFNYAEEFKQLDLDALIKDLEALMTDSQDWWPADYGHYGPLFVRMSWHSAGTYRIQDGRGGAGSGGQRFAPLNSWPDNVNLDKARMLLWPIKQKYGRKISWADLLILTGNVALETMGFKTHGFGGGRVDVWEPERDIWWGPEGEWLADQRYSGDRELQDPLGAVQMGLIYVNPEGPNGNPDALASARDIRDTFGRMAMNDEETVALIAGGHTFGKAHGAADPGQYVGREPEAAEHENMGTGWANTFGSGAGGDTISSGLEGAWTAKPTEWDNGYFDVLFGHEWEQFKSPAGATQWRPKNGEAADAVPDAHDPKKRHAPIMFTSDLALRVDPAYEKISRRFHENPEQLAEAFAKAWYKLTHRDSGPYANLLGPQVPAKPELWQDPIPAAEAAPISDADVSALKKQILDSGLSIPQLVKTAWTSAATFRGSDMRGGANGARIRLAPQKDWAGHEPAELNTVLDKLEGIRSSFGKPVSLADVIVIGGCAAVEAAASKAGHKVSVPFTPGRADATQDQTDVESFGALEPVADGFRNYCEPGLPRSPEELLVDRAQLLRLTAPEMTVLIGGMRAMAATFGGTSAGVLTDTPETLDNSFFVNLLDMGTKWEAKGENEYVGSDRKTGKQKWTGTSADLVFASNSELRALCEHYGCVDAKEQFVDEFVAAWNKVMMNDRFDLEVAAARVA